MTFRNAMNLVPLHSRILYQTKVYTFKRLHSIQMGQGRLWMLETTESKSVPMLGSWETTAVPAIGEHTK